MSDLKLEAGKRYVTRSGWVTPPICFDDNFLTNYAFRIDDPSGRCSVGTQSWTRNGNVHLLGNPDGADLIAEFVSPNVDGFPEGWRIVRFGILQMNEYWIPPDGVPVLNTMAPGESIIPKFRTFIVERITSA